MIPIRGKTVNENMKKVLVALRSGEYTQTIGALQNEGGYCCLGVMCLVYEKETGEAVRRLKPVRRLKHQVNDYILGGNLNPHKEVKEWVGLKTGMGSFDTTVSYRHSLTALNDNENYTFLQIADFIESEPKGLLV
jgi:hypothetical protein